MSFVAGFVTGMSTGEVVERRKGRSQFREYMERRGFTIVDREGRQVPVDLVVDEALESRKNPNRRILVAGVALVAIVVITGGTAWAAVAVLT